MSQTTTLQTKKIDCFSMTGYAQARAERDGWAVRVSVKSVNHRFLDLKLRMPEGFDLYDLRLRQIVREKIHRGHVEVTVGVEPGKTAPIQVNRDLVQAYLKAAEALRQETRAATDMDVVALLRLPGVITGVTTAVPETEEEQERLGSVLDGGLREALAKLDDMRGGGGRPLGGGWGACPARGGRGPRPRGPRRRPGRASAWPRPAAPAALLPPPPCQVEGIAGRDGNRSG